MRIYFNPDKVVWELCMIIFLILMTIGSSCSQQKFEFEGGWRGKDLDPRAFDFDVNFHSATASEVYVELRGNNSITKIELQPDLNGIFSGSFEDQLKVKADLRGEEPIIFFQIDHHLCAVAVEQEDQQTWNGTWRLLQSGAAPFNFLLSFDNNADGSTYVSIFFEEPTFHYMFAEQFQSGDSWFSFVDRRSRIRFEGEPVGKIIRMKMKFLNEVVSLDMLPSNREEWTLGAGDGSILARVEDARFNHLIKDIENDTLERTHAVVIAQEGEVILEYYFDDFTREVLHDTRSLAKSFASAGVGIAISDQLFADEFIEIKSFYEDQYPEIDWSNGKDEVNLFHLMTMSSGIDAIDFGLNRTSYANEGNYQSQKDWTKHILEAPMVLSPGTEGNYGSGSPHLIGPILDGQVGQKLEFYLHKKLFEPLSILDYRIQVTNESRPYFGGGWYLRPIDLIKFGQLYLDGGNYNGDQIIPENWVKKSMQKHVILENTFDKNPYGYLFWHKDYIIAGNSVASIEARGAGGQYLFIVPELQLVSVITSGNYTNNKAFQPERIFRDYILPQFLN